MAHQIEQFSDGSGSFFSARQHAWHRLGVVTAQCLTAEDAIRTARLDWEVTKEPLLADVAPSFDLSGGYPGEQVAVPGFYATMRRHPETGQLDALGVVGERYVPLQNLSTALFLDALVQETGAHFETAGSLMGGRRTFVSMKVPADVKVGGHDAVDLYLVASNSHDGSSAFTVMVTPIRVVCANTLALGTSMAQSRVSLRHTSDVTEAHEQARQVLGLTSTFAEDFAALAEQLHSTPMSTRAFDELIDRVWEPTTEGNGRPTKGTTERRDNLHLLWTSDTQANIAGTAWAAYNAVVEYADWVSPVAGEAKDDLARSTKIAKGDTAAPKLRALQLLTA